MEKLNDKNMMLYGQPYSNETFDPNFRLSFQSLTDSGRFRTTEKKSDNREKITGSVMEGLHQALYTRFCDFDLFYTQNQLFSVFRSNIASYGTLHLKLNIFWQTAGPLRENYTQETQHLQKFNFTKEFLFTGIEPLESTNHHRG